MLNDIELQIEAGKSYNIKLPTGRVGRKWKVHIDYILENKSKDKEYDGSEIVVLRWWLASKKRWLYETHEYWKLAVHNNWKYKENESN